VYLVQRSQYIRCMTKTEMKEVRTSRQCASAADGSGLKTHAQYRAGGKQTNDVEGEATEIEQNSRPRVAVRKDGM
jgi:hypothetical protein